MNLIQLHKICIEEKIKIGISKQASRKNVLQDQVYRREREERKRKNFMTIYYLVSSSVFFKFYKTPYMFLF